MTPDDVPQLLQMLREPSVARFWSEPDDVLDESELLGGDATDPDERITTLAVQCAGLLVGWIAMCESLHRDYRHAGVDLFLATGAQGKGLGPEAIRLVCRHLFVERGHHRITIDPAADNIRAIRAYEAVGFRKVGVMRKYERGRDGTYHDGVLLDLLPEDLVFDPVVGP